MTKNAGSVVAQVLATEIPPEKMQIVSFHPGLIWSKGWEPTGYTRESLPFADGEFFKAYVKIRAFILLIAFFYNEWFC